MLAAIFALLPVSSALFNVIGGSQSVAVTGSLTCNGYPANNVKVKLYNEDTFSMDNFLDEQRSDGSGRFSVRGTENSMSTIEPKLNIYHNCNYNGPCSQKVEIEIPESAVASGGMQPQVFNVGRLELAGNYPGQSTDCLNK